MNTHVSHKICTTSLEIKIASQLTLIEQFTMIKLAKQQQWPKQLASESVQIWTDSEGNR